MAPASHRLALIACLVALPAAARAQSPSPTLPSDTLEANFAPRSSSGPMPELSPTLPSDTLKRNEPDDAPLWIPVEPSDTTGDGWREDRELREDPTFDELQFESPKIRLAMRAVLSSDRG